MIKIWYYKRDNGLNFVKNWIYSFDKSERSYIRYQLDKILKGNFKNCEWVREKVKEIKMDRGYRIYFIEIIDSIILLRAGAKSTQDRDIEKAINDSIDCQELQNGETRELSHRLNKRLERY